MREVGYGVMKDDTTLVGIVPLGIVAATTARTRYIERFPGSTFEIVPVFIGGPVAATVQPPITLSTGTSTDV